MSASKSSGGGYLRRCSAYNLEDCNVVEVDGGDQIRLLKPQFKSSGGGDLRRSFEYLSWWL
jgi:hypothetical protein